MEKKKNEKSNYLLGMEMKKFLLGKKKTGDVCEAGDNE